MNIEQPTAAYRFGKFSLIPASRTLLAEESDITPSNRRFAILLALFERRDRVVLKDELLQLVWPGRVVEEGNLSVHIAKLRKLLGGGVIQTYSARGYRFVAPVEKIGASPGAEPATEPGPRRPERTQTNLLAAATPLIGRETAIAEIASLLEAKRVVTLTGVGGIGKTRLALEVARALSPGFPGGVWLVELASLSDPRLVPSAIAGVLGLRLGGDRISAESVARAIDGMRLLLVLDNCEHVIGAAAVSVESILRACPGASILVTSRESLRIESESTYLVAPLDVPPQEECNLPSVVSHSAVQFLIARMTALRADFSADRENLTAISAICRRLDGIPLAIEFAAVRAVTLGIEQVAARLDDRFALLVDGYRTALPRHQTLRATLDWSYELLSEPEQCLLRRSAVFAGGFTLEAIVAVMSDVGVTPPVAVDVISNLVGKSLLNLDGSIPAGRWRLLETVRAYAIDQLAKNGEAEQALRRHAEYFRDSVAADASVSGSRPSADSLARHAGEIDNVRTALDWAYAPGGDPVIGHDLTAGYVPVWLHLELMPECRDRTERALDVLDHGRHASDRLRTRLHIGLGVALLFTNGPVEKTRAVLSKARTLAEISDDVDAQLRTLWCFCLFYWNIGECRMGQSVAEQFLDIARRTGDPDIILVGERLVGNALQNVGLQNESRRFIEHVVEASAANGRQITWFRFDQRVLAKGMLARVLWLQGLTDQAGALSETTLEEAQATGRLSLVLFVLAFAQCPVSIMLGDFVAAERAVGMLLDLSTRNNATYFRDIGRCLEAKLLIKRGDWAAGSRMMRAALNVCDRSGWTIWYPEFLGVLSEAWAGLGDFVQSHATLDQALARAERTGERWYAPELDRIKGELLLQETGDRGVAAADESFLMGIEEARRQGALFWELRVAVSVARLRMRQGRGADARALLTDVSNRITEGFDNPDLIAARKLLDDLS